MQEPIYIYGERWEVVRDAKLKVAESIGNGAPLQIFCFEGARIPVTKDRLELLFPNGSRDALRETSEAEEIPEDGVVIGYDVPGGSAEESFDDEEGEGGPAASEEEAEGGDLFGTGGGEWSGRS